MFLLSLLKHSVVISAPTVLKGKFGKGRRASTLRFTVLGRLWCHLGSLSVAPWQTNQSCDRSQAGRIQGREVAAGTPMGAAGSVSLPRVSSPQARREGVREEEEEPWDGVLPRAREITEK